MADGETWTSLENEVVVAAYLGMLERELRDEPFVKARINEEVRKQIGRSRGSVEFKFRNVSAVLRELNHPFVDGYKAAPNFQDSLRDAVIAQLDAMPSLQRIALDEFSRAPGLVTDFEWNVTMAPKVEFTPQQSLLRRAAKIDFVQVDAANRALGLAGELAVVDLERRRLRDAGLGRLAKAVRHVSVEDGDGLGFDIQSFGLDGEEKFIEVKTTRRGQDWPMMISSNEVHFSQEEPDRFHLYRVYNFDRPKRGLYELAGDVTRSCRLRPAQFEALPA